MALDFLYRQFLYALTMCRAKSRQGTKYIDDDSFENVSTNGKIILGSKKWKIHHLNFVFEFLRLIFSIYCHKWYNLLQRFYV